MPTDSSPLRPILVEWMGAAATVTLLTALAAGFGWFWRLDQTLYDAALVLRHRPAPHDIVIVAIDQQSLDQIGRWPVAFEGKHADKRDLFVSVVPFSGSGGERRGLLVSLVDVTILKEAERKRDEYMRFLSHDLRSPLVTITAMLDLRELAPETQKADFFDRIRRSVERSLTLAEDFVQLGRAEAVAESRFTAVDLVDLMTSAIDEAESQAYKKDMRILLAFAPEAALARGVRDVLFRVFINLLSNAIKYSAGNTRIECTIEPEGDRWRCTFADQGYGIAAEDLPRLFDRFERLEAAKRRGERGAGLGLAFVKTAVEKHGGRIEVTSEPGKGSRFIVFLPVLR